MTIAIGSTAMKTTTTATSRDRRLRERFAGPRMFIAPSAYDYLSAKVIQATGFDAVHLTGADSPASVLGRVDLGGARSRLSWATD